MNKLRITCLDVNCPERKGGVCQGDLEGTRAALVRDICSVRRFMPKSEADMRIRALIAEEIRQVQAGFEVTTEAATSNRDLIPGLYDRVLDVFRDRIAVLTGRKQ